MKANNFINGQSLGKNSNTFPYINAFRYIVKRESYSKKTEAMTDQENKRTSKTE